MIQEVCKKHEWGEMVLTTACAEIKSTQCRKCGALKPSKDDKKLRGFKQIVLGEWQLCPKCNGDGHLGRYNSPSLACSTCPICDICHGAKILAKPIIK